MYNLYCKSIHFVIPQVFMISTNTKCNSFDVYICMLICVCSKGPLFWEIKYLYCIVFVLLKDRRFANFVETDANVTLAL